MVCVEVPTISRRQLVVMVTLNGCIFPRFWNDEHFTKVFESLKKEKFTKSKVKQ